MSIDYTDLLDTAIGPNGNKIAVIAEKGSDNKFRIPAVIRNSAGTEIFTPEKPGAVAISGSIAQEFEQITIDATSGGIGLTSEKYGTKKKVVIQVESAPIRFRFDGGAPTATVGYLAYIGSIIELESNEDIANFKAIRSSDVNAKITCTYSNCRGE